MAQKLKNFLVLDFEATCDRVRIDPQEIIEFPCLLLNDKLEQVATFHEYIRPVGIQTLTPFCTELTGITQDMVDEKSNFSEVLAKFCSWVEENGISSTDSSFVTCGQWDLVDMLPRQCKYSGDDQTKKCY